MILGPILLFKYFDIIGQFSENLLGWPWLEQSHCNFSNSNKLTFYGNVPSRASDADELKESRHRRRVCVSHTDEYGLLLILTCMVTMLLANACTDMYASMVSSLLLNWRMFPLHMEFIVSRHSKSTLYTQNNNLLLTIIINLLFVSFLNIYNLSMLLWINE